MEKIGLYVDVQNVYYTTRDAFGRPFDYRSLWRRLAAAGELSPAIAYATDRGDDAQRRFQDALRHLGFTVRLKPFIQRADGSAKGDWDVGIAIDVLNNAEHVDRVVLLSGDGDFDLLAETIREKHGIPFDVYGVAALTAESLKRAASSFHPITASMLL